MSDLLLRKLPFNFDDVEFDWHPENPPISMMMNSVSFQVIGFEQYMCRAMRDAEEFITDPAILAEARTFGAQEMIHSKAHMKHIRALLGRYPSLKNVVDASVARYDQLYKAESLHFHLAYAANIEATFTPLFGTIIEHRKALFSGGDPRITALMLWHFCEEIEHRSSAITVYNHVVGSSLYRMRQLPKVLRFAKEDVQEIYAGFAEHVPDAPKCGAKGAFARIPPWPRAKMTMGIIESQMPWHNPERGHVPAYYGAWRSRYERGEDMTVEADLTAHMAIA